MESDTDTDDYKCHKCNLIFPAAWSLTVHNRKIIYLIVLRVGFAAIQHKKLLNKPYKCHKFIDEIKYFVLCSLSFSKKKYCYFCKYINFVTGRSIMTKSIFAATVVGGLLPSLTWNNMHSYTK